MGAPTNATKIVNRATNLAFIVSLDPALDSTDCSSRRFRKEYPKKTKDKRAQGFHLVVRTGGPGMDRTASYDTNRAASVAGNSSNERRIAAVHPA